jgi:trimethylamine---corrinoid protein Co-methyltransferase
MAGITGPMQHMGTIVLQNAEILSGIVFCKLINPDLPIVYSPSSTTGYMKDASYICGTPDMMMLNAPLLMMAHEFYHLPSRCMCGMTDAKGPDMQAGFETFQNIMLAVLADADIISQCLGVLDSIMTISYEKHIIDEEIIKRCLYIKAGIDTSREALSLDLIKEVGPGAAFLTHLNTYKHFKDVFQNEISECESYYHWQANGALDIVERANKQFKEILEKAPDTMLDRETDKALCSYIKKHIR